MPFVTVCPLSQVAATVAATDASHLVSLINDDTPVVRPPTIPEERHLFLGINDIVEPAEGMILPALEHVHDLVTFVRAWDQERPIVVLQRARNDLRCARAVPVDERDHRHVEVIARL